jgi:hypothetical protein
LSKCWINGGLGLAQTCDTMEACKKMQSDAYDWGVG